jgi:hypothetical protein
MSEILPEIVKEFAKLPALLQEIYGDLAKPGATQVGKALGTIFGLGNTILWPIAWANARARAAEDRDKIALEINLDKYRKSLEAVLEEQIIPVSPEIGVPILEKLTYVTDDELSDMYINLLANASTVNTARFAHPAFVHIINSLSPDEALLLKEFDRRGRGPIPSHRVKWRRRAGGVIVEYPDILTGIEYVVLFAFPKNLFAYFSNLDGLGIVKITFNQLFKPKAAYEELMKFYEPLYQQFARENNLDDPQQYTFLSEPSRIDMTPFGRLFLDSCLKKINRERGDTSP